MLGLIDFAFEATAQKVVLVVAIVANAGIFAICGDCIFHYVFLR